MALKSDTLSVENSNTIEVEVAYALPDKQKIIKIKVPAGTTAMEMVELSGIVREFPDIDLASAKMGLFGKHLGTKGLAGPDEYVLQARDRIEIYRPLLIDPKEVRRQRAAKKQADSE
jgi:hypothetical protein